MATILTQTHAFFAIPFDSTTDFTVLAGLLFDLVVYFADERRAPRWIRTASAILPKVPVVFPARSHVR